MNANSPAGQIWSTGACSAITGGDTARIPIGVIPFDGYMYEITIYGDETDPNSGLIFYDFARLGPAVVPVPVPVPVPAPVPEREATIAEWEFWEKVTGLTGAALILYLIISEGTRIFPPRNLIPIP